MAETIRSGRESSSGVMYGIIRFAVRHPVPVNLLMVTLIVGGVIFGLTIRREMFPEIRPERAVVGITYPGASPSEVQEGMVLKIEDAIADLEEVEEVTSTITEGAAAVIVEFTRDVKDVDRATDRIRSAIDTLQDLPEDADPPRTAKIEMILPVIAVSLYGDADEASLKKAGRSIQEDLESLEGMGLVQLSGVRDAEIRVEARPEALLRFDLSIAEVSDRIGQWMKETPGGTVRSGVESVRIRTLGVAEGAETIRGIVVKSDEEGRAVRVGDVASVRETFEDVDLDVRMNGHPSVRLTVFNQGDGDTVEIAKMVREYVAGRTGAAFAPGLADRRDAIVNRLKGAEGGAELRRSGLRQAYELGVARSERALPGDLIVHNDLARFIEGRLDLMLNNAKQGAWLIFATLLVMLNVRAAVWVMVGVVTSLLGALMVMAAMGITLNLLTMFGLITVLGILGDDAVVISENIYHKFAEGLEPEDAAIEGTVEIAWPVISTVTTTIVAFVPLALVEGQIGDFLGQLPVIVAVALILSTVETLIILPPHMAHSLRVIQQRKPGAGSRLMRRFDETRERVIEERILPKWANLVDVLLRNRYVTLGAAMAIWIVSVGLVAGGRVEFTFFAGTDSEIVVVDVRLPVGASRAQTESAVRRLEAAWLAQPDVLNVEAMVGIRLDTNDWTVENPQTHIGQLYVEMQALENRSRTSAEIIAAVRAAAGEIVGVSSIRYEEMQGGPAGPSIEIAVSGDDEAALFAVADELKGRLTGFEGVFDVGDDADHGRRELQIALRAGSTAAGIDSAMLARQIRGAVFGLEAHTFSTDREDVDVRVILDEASRRTLATIQSLFVRTSGGAWVPLMEIAEVREETAYATIRRLGRHRVVTVLAEVDDAIANPETIMAGLEGEFEGIEARHPGVHIEARGRQLETVKSLSSLRVGFLVACGLIYVNLAWLFNSYTQPFAVMLAIPFSLVGVIWGHYLMGYRLMILSLIGFVALTGVAVNDSLIYLEYYNGRRAEGVGAHEALVLSGRRRLRQIFVTAITTVLGLLPLILEDSFQARILIPMALSLGFGLLSSTVLVLLVLPSMVLIGHDLRGLARFLWTGEWPAKGSGGVEAAP